MFEIIPLVKIWPESACRMGTSGSAYYSPMRIGIWIILMAGIATDMTSGNINVSSVSKAIHVDYKLAARTLRLLIENGADPNEVDEKGYTPLHAASEANRLLNAAILLENGARINAKTKEGFTPLHLTAQEGHAGMAALLLDLGADVNVRSENGFTPLHVCAEKGTLNVAAVLAAYGSDFSAQANDGRTPLDVPGKFGEPAMIHFLMDYYGKSYTRQSGKSNDKENGDNKQHASFYNALEEMRDSEARRKREREHRDSEARRKREREHMRDSEARRKREREQMREL